MFLIIATFIISFLICISISFFCLIKKNVILNNWHLSISIICITFWALYAQFTFAFFGIGFGGDFSGFYMAAQRLLKDPNGLYNYGVLNPYVYLPSFATSLILICLFPFWVAYTIFLIINYICAIFSIIEYDKILRFLNLKKKIHRFLFLIIISNGYLLYTQFYFNMFKTIMLFIFLYVIRKEIQFRIEKKEKSFKYYMVNYCLLIYAIGVAPYFFFLILIYLFQEIKFKEILQLENFKKYSIVIFFFLIENIIFILYPSTILGFIKGFNMPTQGPKLMRMLYLKDLFQPTKRQMQYIMYVFTSILAIISLILIINRKLKIEEKFSYFFLAFLFFGVFSYQILLAIILFSFILLLFVPFLNQEVSGFDFIRVNKIFLIGLISIGLIFILTNDFLFYLCFPIYFEYENYYFDAYYLLILHIIMMSCLLTLNLKKFKLI